MIYSPNNCLDTQWCYIVSHEVNRTSGAEQGDETQEKSLVGKPETQGANSARREAFDRLSGIVDTDESRFQKLKQENFKYWEQSVSSLCQSMNIGVDTFYQGNFKVLKQIQSQAIKNREDYIPIVCEHDSSPIHTQEASAPYLFQQFPLTNSKIDSSFNDDLKLSNLSAKLSECAPLSFWNEPIEMMNNGPEFFDGICQLILKTAKSQAQDKDTITHEDIKSLQNLQSQAIRCMFGIATLSGNHDLIVAALDTLSKFELLSNDEAYTKAVFTSCCEILKSFLAQLDAVKNSQQPVYHCMQGTNMSGVFGIAYHFNPVGMTDRNSSITTDNTYLYLYVSLQSRSFMMKIGTGENGSTPGRVYNKTDTNDVSEITWVFCKGKLYLKKVGEPLGLLNVIDPVTFACEGQVKLSINDCFSNPKQMEALNRNYPLLSDGESLFIVTVQVVQKNKTVREELRPEFELLQAKMKIDAKKVAEKSSASVKEKNEADKKEAIMKKAEELKNQKEARSKKKGPKKEEPKNEEAPKAQTSAELVPCKEIDIYRVCEFSVHQFDLEAKQNLHIAEFQNKPDHELLQEPLCCEMFQAFSGLFSVQDCQKALKFNNNDIEVAVQWLIEDKSKPKNEKTMPVKQSQIIYESLVQQYNQVSLTNVDVQVVNSAILQPHHITTGKWTLADSQLTFHNTGQDQEVISVFSLKSDDFKQVNQDKMLQTFQMPSYLFERNDFTQHFYDGKEWKCYTMQQICELIVKVKSLKELTASTDSPKSDNAAKRADFYSPEGFISEVQLYQPIILNGTLLAHKNSLQRGSSLHQNAQSYITYCPFSRKYFFMAFNNNDRNIAIVEDLACVLPKASPQTIQEFSSFSSFVKETLKQITYINESRLQMPWRWRHWSHFYASAIEQIENQRTEQITVNKMNINPLSGLPDSTPEKNEQKHQEAQENKKTLIKKLKKRQTKVTQRELQIELQKFGLNTLNEKEIKDYHMKAQKQQLDRLAWNEKKAKLNKQPSQSAINAINVGKMEPVQSIPKLQNSNAQLDQIQFQSNPFSGSGIFGDKKNLPFPGRIVICDNCGEEMRFGFGESVCQNCGVSIKNTKPWPDFGKYPPQIPNSYPQQPQGQYALPQEHICIARENKKVYAFCPTGSVHALKSIFSILKTNGDDKTILRAMLDQVVFADNLSAYHDSSTLDDIYSYCIERLQANVSIDVQQYLWRILIIGWHLFVRTQHQQLQTLILALTQSRKTNSYTQPKGSLKESLTRVTSNIAPIALFCIRFISHPTFYPLEFLTQSKVTAQIVTAQSESVYMPVQTKHETELRLSDKEAEHKFTPIKQAYARSYDSNSTFNQFSKFNQSIQQMPLEILVLRQAKASQGLFGQTATDSYTFKSQAYFSMPIQSVFMSELCQMNVLTDTIPKDLDQLISYYTNQSFKGSADAEDTQKLKFEYFVNVREKSAKMQDELFKLFAQSIFNSLVEPEEADGKECWDDAVSGYFFNSFGFLIMQSIISYSWEQPYNTDLMIKAVKFLEEVVILLSKKTNNFQKKFVPHYWKWLDCIQGLSQQMINMLHLSIGYQSQTYLSVKILPSLVTILENFRKVFSFTDDKTGQLVNTLDLCCAPHTEGIDSTQEIVWQTTHPYPKIDSRQTDQIKVPNAIGYYVEFDPRCCTLSGNDYLQLKTSETETHMGEQVGTRFRISGRINPGQNVYILIGKQLEIEFLVKVPRERGRRPGEPDGRQQTSDDKKRWGFKVSILPIFMQPDCTFKTSSGFKEIKINSKQDKENLQMLLHKGLQFFTVAVYIASTFTQDLTAKFLLKEGAANREILIEQEDFINNERGLISLNDAQKNREAAIMKQISQSDVLNWHLLKGGLNLQFAKQGPNAITDVDTHMEDCLRQISKQNLFKRQQQSMLKELQSPPTKYQDQSENSLFKKVPSIMRKKTSVKPDSDEETFRPNKECWATEIRDLVTNFESEGETLDLVLKKIRRKTFKYYEIGYEQIRMRPSFKPYLPLWQSVERLLIAAMVYHSDSVSDIRKFLDSDETVSDINQQQMFLKEQFQTIGRQINVVLRWMLERLAGQKQLNEVAEKIVEIAQTHIDAAVNEKERLERESKAMAVEDAIAAQIREDEKKRKALEEKAKEEKKQEPNKNQTKKPVVSVSKNKAPANKGKRANRPQLARVLPKPQEKKKKPQIDKPKEPETKPQEEQKHEQEVDKEPEIEFLELEGKQLLDLKNTIEKEVLAYLNKFFEPDPQTMKNQYLNILALYFDLELDLSEYQMMITKVFKQIKLRLAKLLDLDDPEALLCRRLDLEVLKLGKPEEQVATDTKNRILLLLELNNSVNFLSEVTKIDGIKKFNTFWRNKRMATILEEQEEDQQSQQQILTELSEGLECDAEKFDSDSDETLQPIEAKRSYSVPTFSSQPKMPPFGSLQANGAQNEKQQEQRKKSVDYSEWVESYRKWRLWNKKGEDEPELLSPFGSPLLSVVSFVKNAKVQNPSVLRKIMLDQQKLAMFRLFGLQMQEKLFNMFGQSLFGKYVWGYQSLCLQESTLYSVETCGERLTKQLNVSSRALVTLLMDQFVKTVSSQQEKEHNQQLKDKEKAKSKSSSQEVPLQRQNTQQREEIAKAQMIHDENIQLEDLKKIVLLLNDIRVLMNNIYTREHVLESLRQDNKISTQDSLGIDKIQAFLKAVVQFLMISTHLGSDNKQFQVRISKVKQNIQYVTRLVLNLFICQDKIMIRQTETQRILQEMLLDITVNQLESKCYYIKKGAHKSRFQNVSNQEQQMQLLQLLCEVIRISNDTQAKYQADQKESNSQDDPEGVPQQVQIERTPTYFLSAGSQKVIRCASLLAFLLHNVDVPQVMRQTIKCASLLFKLLDLRKLKLQGTTTEASKSPLEQFIQSSIKNGFLVETLKTIGSKIGNVPFNSDVSPISQASDPVKPEIELKQEVEEKKDVNQASDQISTEKQSTEDVQIKNDAVAVAVAEKIKIDKESYYVICNMNTPEQEDFLFIFNALFHWYLRYPNKSIKLVEDPSEICQVPKAQPAVQPKPGEEKKEEQKLKPPKEEQKLPEIVAQDKIELVKSLKEMLKDEQAVEDLKAAEEMLKRAALEHLQDEISLSDLAAEEQKLIDADIKLIQEIQEAENAFLQAHPSSSEAIIQDQPSDQPGSAKINELELIQAEEDKKEVAEVEKVDEKPIQMEDKPEQSQQKKPEPYKMNRPKNLEYFLAHIPEIILVQQQVRVWLAQRKISKKPVAFDVAVDETDKLRRLKKKLEGIKEIRNSEYLQKELEVQKKEIQRISAQIEAQKLAKLAPEKIEKANPQKLSLAHSSSQPNVRDYLKSKFEDINIGERLPESINNSKITQLIQAVEQIAKETYKDPLTTDTDQEKRRCMDEKNYNTRIMAILKETRQIAEQLQVRNIAILEGPYSFEKAQELSELLLQSYRGQLIPVGCNPNMKEEMANKPIALQNGEIKASFSANQIFPITSAKLEEISRPKKKQDTAVPEIIKVAQNTCVITLIQRPQAQDFVNESRKRIFETQKMNRQKSPGLPSMNAITFIEQKSLVQGSSQSLIIQELVQLIRQMLQGQDGGDNSNQIQDEFVSLLNYVTQQLATREWDYELSDYERFIIIGLFYVTSGWQPQIKAGQLIQVNENNVWSNATVVDEGAGKDKISVILEEDDFMQITKISREKARPVNRFMLELDGDFGSKIDLKSLIRAVISVYQQTRNSEAADAERICEYASNAPTTFTKSILSSQNLLLQMLRTCSQLKWTIQKDEDIFSEFIQIMINVSAGKERGSPGQEDLMEFEEDKLMAHWERFSIQAWERLVDKSEIRNLRMFAPREFVYPEGVLKRQSTQMLQKEGIQKPSIKDVRPNNILQEDQFSPEDFTQSQNSFLSGLPLLPQKSNYQLHNLKRLQYWERHVIPHLIKFCTGYYKGWEWEQYFGQLRAHLYQGNVAEAWNDQFQMFGRNVPPGGVIIPENNYDWSPKIIDECVCDEWAIALISPLGAKLNGKQAKDQQSNTTTAKSSIPIIDRLLHLEIDEILVQIKAVDNKSNSVFAQYFDPDSMTTSYFWLPINNLIELTKPLPHRSIGFSNKKLADDYERSIQKISQIYSRQTLIKLFKDFQQQQKPQTNQILSLPGQNLKLQELICWCVWESFCNSPIDGWLKQVSPVIMLDSQTGTKTSNLRPTFKNIVEQTLDIIAKEEIIKSQYSNFAKSNKQKETGETRSTEHTLSLVCDIFSEIASKQVDSDPVDPLINELVDWCVTNWYAISSSIGKGRACIDLSEAFRQFQVKKPQDDASFSNLLPLHNLVPGKGANANATLILFKKDKKLVKLTPGSKVMLYSDAEKTDLLREISAQSQQGGNIDPLLIAKGKVWVDFEEGSNCLVPIALRDDERSIIQCAVFHVPKEWTVVCWLTEVLTTTLVRNAIKKAPQFVIEVFSKLIGAIQAFYDESRAPDYLKMIVLKLLSRLIIKLRVVYIAIENQNLKQGKSIDIASQEHFKRLFISPEFVQTLLSELLFKMDTVACNALKKGQPEPPVAKGLSQVLEFQSRDKVLHPHFAQDAIEFLMHFFVPTSRKLKLRSYNELLPNKPGSNDKIFQMPLWLEPLLNISAFLHYLRKQQQMPLEIQLKIFDLIKLGESNLDNIIVLRGLPIDDPIYTRNWIRNRIFELIRKHKARVLQPAYDVTFVSNPSDPNFFNAIIILDGFSHMRLADDGQGSSYSDEIRKKHQIELLYVDSEEEEGVNPSQALEEAKQEAERKKREEEEKVTQYECPSCTFFNPISATNCDMCMTPAPPLEAIKAAHLARLIEERKARGEVVDAPAKVEVDSLNLKRLKLLQSDLRHMISHEQRIKLLAEVEEQKKRDKAEAERKALQLAEEEAKNAVEKDKQDDQSAPKKQSNPVQDRQDEVKAEAIPVEPEVKPLEAIPVQRLNSLASNESGKDDKDWEDAENSDSIDLENLPEDREERHRILGIESWVLEDGDEQTITLMEMSAIEAIQKKQEIQKKEREEKQKADEEERKRKEREAQKAALASSGKPIALLKIETTIGQKQVFENDQTSQIAQQVLRMRLMERMQNDGFKFSEQVVKIIRKINAIFMQLQLEDLYLPENEPLLADFEITKEFLKEVQDFDTVLELFQTMAIADVRLLYKVFESQGFDVHLTEAALPSHNVEALISTGLVSRNVQNLTVLSQVKRLIELDYGNYSCLEIHFEPSELRLLHKYEQIQAGLKQFQKLISAQSKDVLDIDAQRHLASDSVKAPEQEQIKTVQAAQVVKEDSDIDSKMSLIKPIAFFDDSICEANYQEVYNDVSMSEVRYMWSVLKTFNEFYVPAVPIINQHQSFIDVPSNSVPLNIGLYMKDLRDLSLSCVKSNLRFLILDQTSVEVEKSPVLMFERLKMAGKQESPQPDSSGQRQNNVPQEAEEIPEKQSSQVFKDFMFIKAYEQLRDIELAVLRKKRPQGSEPHLAFEVEFLGEDVVGTSGPYKQFFSSISNEIQPSKNETKLDTQQLGLTVPCANQRDKEQFGGDKFVLISSDLTQKKLQYFEFLGIIMGVCIRTGINLVLDLPSIFWKQLIGSNPNLDDIFQIEYRFFKKINGILNATEPEFSSDDAVYYWTVTLADGKELDLTSDGTGKDRQVKYCERYDFVQRCIYTKLTESSVQCAAIRRGLVKIIPESMLNQISFEEMESWVCGDKFIDIDLVRRNTKLVGYTVDDEVIKNFWEIFESLTQPDRRRFIKFCYAIERLPQTDEDWKRLKLEFTIVELKKTSKQNKPVPADDLLPEAQTCFFQFKLPRYTSKERMKRQIICAFTIDNESMNAENDVNAREMRRVQDHDERRDSYGSEQEE